MTTIKISKSMNLSGTDHTFEVEIDAVKIEEIQTKTFVNYNLPQINSNKKPTTDDKTNATDYKQVVRTFTVSGTIDVNSATDAYIGSAIAAPRSVLDVRDLLSWMNLYGGASKFMYGIPADYVGLTSGGYTPNEVLGYFYTSGITVLFSRLRMEEVPGDMGRGKIAGSSVEVSDYLISDGAETFNDSKGVGTPKYGLYYLPSQMTISIEMMEIKEGYI